MIGILTTNAAILVAVIIFLWLISIRLRTSRPPPGRCPTSRPAPAPPTSSRALLRFCSISGFATVHTAEDLKRQVHAILDRHDLDYDLAWTLGGKPFLTPRSALVAAMEKAIHQTLDVTPELSTTGGTSDGRFIAEICPQVVEFGPVNATIHKLDECIAINAVAPLSEIYRRTLSNLLTPSDPA